jgi:hypothetical protein
MPSVHDIWLQQDVQLSILSFLNIIVMGGVMSILGISSQYEMACVDLIGFGGRR